MIYSSKIDPCSSAIALALILWTSSSFTLEVLRSNWTETDPFMQTRVSMHELHDDTLNLNHIVDLEKTATPQEKSGRWTWSYKCAKDAPTTIATTIVFAKCKWMSGKRGFKKNLWRHRKWQTLEMFLFQNTSMDVFIQINPWKISITPTKAIFFGDALPFSWATNSFACYVGVYPRSR